MKKQSRNRQPLTNKLKQTIKASGLSHLRLSQETGVARASLVRFMQNERSIRLDVADKLARYFGLELLPQRKKKTII